MPTPSPRAVRSLHRSATKHLQSAAHWDHECHWSRRISLKPESFWWQNAETSLSFLQKHSPRPRQRIQCFFSQFLWETHSQWVFQFMTSIQITPELTIFCILNSWLPLNYFSLLFFVIQLFCTTRTWGQDIILIRGALKSLKLSHFVSSFSLKYMRHQPIVRIFCSKYHRVLRWMFFLYFCFLEV